MFIVVCLCKHTPFPREALHRYRGIDPLNTSPLPRLRPTLYCKFIMTTLSTLRRVCICLCILFFIQIPVYAHVKWFSSFAWIDPPLPLSEVLNPLFFILASLSALGIAAAVFLDDLLMRQPLYKSLEIYLQRLENKSDLIIRIATGSVLLLSWQSGTWLVPELLTDNSFIEITQLILALLIVSNRLTRYAGIGLIFMYVSALLTYGFLHMLDYVYLVGAGYYLVVISSSKKTRRASALPGLYASVGFSLFWAAIEKLVYPQWALSILQKNPFLTLGFDPVFFLQGAAFVEISLGFILIVCLLQRPVALIITMIFISTTLIFGKVEFVGHAIVHAALIVFILKGHGDTFRTPVTFFYHMQQRLIFSVVSFCMMLLVLVPWYTYSAHRSYEQALASMPEDPHNMQIETAELADVPQVALTVEKDDHSGWNLYLSMSNFEFSPEDCGDEHKMGYGHAHLYLNGQKIARLYSPWYHLTDLEPGTYELTVSLNSNNHGLYVNNGEAIASTQQIIVN